MTARRGGRTIDLEAFDEPMMTRNEAARALGVSRVTFLKWEANRDIPVVTYPGGIVRVKASVVRAFLAKAARR